MIARLTTDYNKPIILLVLVLVFFSGLIAACLLSLSPALS